MQSSASTQSKGSYIGIHTTANIQINAKPRNQNIDNKCEIMQSKTKLVAEHKGNIVTLS
jgi:hypothetical protein